MGKKLKKDTGKQTYVKHYGIAVSKARIDGLVEKGGIVGRIPGPEGGHACPDRKLHRPQVALMLLDAINTPKDIKELNVSQLASLAEEMEIIIRTISKTGGHLSSNLGIVELTLALHYVFDTPAHRIVWDAGHQCYTHKIITELKGALLHHQTAGRSERLSVQER